ncbi:MAG: TonB-dependent receptor [Muribaculaceae bacterium]|nr:TonB-dependent receptor [Muribaculaceae bacterium]
MILFTIFPLHGAVKVRGGVTAEDGEPLAGATVIWVGSSRGTVTDEDGLYEITRPKGASLLVASYVGCVADTVSVAPDEKEVNFELKYNILGEINVNARGKGLRRLQGVENSSLMGRTELFKAACCNLGESFTTNPSVDVTYSDAATGAKQIRLLGLSGSYVQMLTENIPNFRGISSPYSLGYVPGPWMQSIQISKGCSSVKNGYESITGQIDIEYLKPQSEEQFNANLYGDSKAKIEANADGNIHITDKLSTALMLHYEDALADHDENKDGFSDAPRIRQVNALNRWAYFSPRYIMQTSINLIDERRKSGVSDHTIHSLTEDDIRQMSSFGNMLIKSRRYDVWSKNAFIIDPDDGRNIAIMLNYSNQTNDGIYGQRTLDSYQSTFYGSLMFETNASAPHSLSAGVSLNNDHLRHISNMSELVTRTTETVPGIYAQYTFNHEDKVVAMAGLRYDHSNLFGSFVTPRAHLKWNIRPNLSLRGSAGKGYRTVNSMAEYSYLLTSSLPVVFESPFGRDEAWNFGISSSWSFSLWNRNFSLAGEYYYTTFEKQLIADRESNPSVIQVLQSDSRSYSHTVQIELTAEPFKGFTVTGAYRYNDVRETYSGVLLRKALVPRYKGLVTASYTTPLELWQFDATLQLNGGGRMPAAPVIDGKAAWGSTFKSYTRLNLQVTRHWRNISVYVGGENLTGFTQKNPVVYLPSADLYDPTMVWGPVHGAMFYAGFRLNLKK